MQLAKNKAFGGGAETSDKAVKVVGTDTRKESEALDRWHGSLAVSKIPRTRMIEIKFTSPDPKLAAQVVNTLATVYVENNFKARYESTMQASEWLSKQLADLQLKVETSQAALVKYQRDNGIVGIDEKQNTITSKLDQLNKDLTAAEDDRLNQATLTSTVW